jgi:hypothetical protein
MAEVMGSTCGKEQRSEPRIQGVIAYTNSSLTEFASRCTRLAVAAVEKEASEDDSDKVLSSLVARAREQPAADDESEVVRWEDGVATEAAARDMTEEHSSSSVRACE